MRPQPTLPAPTPEDVDHFRAALRELVDHGLDITRSLAAQAKADPVPHPFWGNKAPVEYPTEHLATCYDRVTRSVRRSIALALTLHLLPNRTPPQPGTQPHAANDERPNRPNRPDRPERLDRPDWHEPNEAELFAADATRPVDDVITEIRTDYAALGHPILTPVPSPRPPRKPAAQTPNDPPANTHPRPK